MAKKTFKAQQPPKKKSSYQDLLATFCCYYPQYKFHEADAMPYRRIVQMLRVAQVEQAKKMYELVQIVAAPHTKKGAAINKLLAHYKKLIG